MRWFKHNCQSTDEVLNNLFRSYSFTGIGFYWKLIECICSHEGSLPVETMISWSCSKMKKDDMFRIIYIICNKHFYIDANNYIHMTQALCHEISVSFSHTYADDPAEALTKALTKALTEAPSEVLSEAATGDPDCAGHIPSSSTEEVNNIETRLDEDEEEIDFDNVKTEWIPFIKKLRGKDSEIWRETLTSQLNEFDLIRKHWNWCVKYFVEFIAAKGGEITSLEDLRRHFLYFARGSKTSTHFYRALHRHDKLYQSRTDSTEGTEKEKAQFELYMKTNCPHLVNMEDPLTLSEYRSLRSKFGKEEVISVLNKMENRTDLSNYRSCYKTALEWLQR